jgi:hypothetical protein
MGVFGFADSALSESPEWDALVQESYDFLYKQQDILEEDYLLSTHKRWDYDQDTGELVFSNDGVPSVIAEFQFVGSISTTSETWLWSWANSTIDEKLSKELDAVYTFGETNGFSKLTDAKWDADETDGWERSAIANYILKGQGIYRPPSESGLSFMVITKIKKVEN